MRRFLPAFALLSLLAACSSGSGSGSGGGPGGAPPLDTPVNPQPPPAPPTPPGPPPAGTFTFLPHQGLEMLDPVGPASAGTIVAAPTGSLNMNAADLDVTAGFRLTFQDIRTDRGDIPYPAAPAGTRLFTACTPCVGPNGGEYFATEFTGGAASTLHYATYGTWTHYADAFDRERSYGVFAAGLRTGGDRPATGTATYSGAASGYISTSAGNRHSFTSRATLSADFGANTISGGLSNLATTQIRAQGLTVMSRPRGTANDIQFSAGTISGTTFSGTAKVLDAPAGAVNPSVNILGAAGNFGGLFYGPGAAEAAGSLALTGAGVNVIGAFGAAK